MLSGHAHSKSLFGFSNHKCEHGSFEHGFGTFKLKLKFEVFFSVGDIKNDKILQKKSNLLEPILLKF